MEFLETTEKTVNNGFLKGKIFFVGRGSSARMRACERALVRVRVRACAHACMFPAWEMPGAEAEIPIRKRAKRNTGPHLSFVK